jgi:insertion element IS1 protein InsB
MNKCYKSVGGLMCHNCSGSIIKHGLVRGRQRYKCKSCKGTQMDHYRNNACNILISNDIVNHVKEGCGIRSIARLLNISAVTVLKRIQCIADGIKKPMIPTGRIYEVNELKTYVKKKTNDYWVIYAIDKESRQVVDFKAGKRTKKNIKRVTDTLLLAECKQIYTDGLDIYGFVIPKKTHSVKRYGTNHIERKNLSLRTHLKRLNRKTICYSKSLLMLNACLKIYFWHEEAAA